MFNRREYALSIYGGAVLVNVGIAANVSASLNVIHHLVHSPAACTLTPLKISEL